jgi:hypothetical protein
MNRDLAMRRNRGELFGFLGWMLASFQILREMPVGLDAQAVHLAVLRMLRAVEAAVRRLVSVQASGMVVEPSRVMPGDVARGAGALRRMPVFRLLDPRKAFGSRPYGTVSAPRVTVIGLDDWTPADGADAVRKPLNIETLRRRLVAVQGALDDLPKQARRLVRWRMRQQRLMAAGNKRGPLSPMRPGWPPGYRVDGREAFHVVLLECDVLARRVENEPIRA